MIKTELLEEASSAFTSVNGAAGSLVGLQEPFRSGQPSKLEGRVTGSKMKATSGIGFLSSQETMGRSESFSR
jgi:hypothetical protein